MRSWVKFLVAMGLGTSGCAHNAIKPNEQDLRRIAAKLLPQIEARAAEYGFSQDDSWVLREAPSIDELGRVVARFDRWHAKLRVVGGDVITHSNLGGPLRIVRFVSPLTKPLDLALQPKVTESAAKEAASGRQVQGEVAQATLVIWAVDGYRQTPRLAWNVRVGGRQILIAADDGKELDEVAHILTAECGDGLRCTPTKMRLNTAYPTGTTRAWASRRSRPEGRFPDYALHDTERQIRVSASSFTRADADAAEGWWHLGLVDATPGTTVSLRTARVGNGQIYDGSDTETSSDRLTAAADLYVNLGRTYGYFAATFGRYGFNGRRILCVFPDRICRIGEGPIEATVNVPTRNAAYDETTRKLWFGYDRTASPTWGPMVELDIVAHEYTHGITMHTARLLYNRYDSGALNDD